jgi:hypothetical protein
VTPRVDATLVPSSIRGGYRFQDIAEATLDPIRIVDLPENVMELLLPDLEVPQVQALQIRVTDASGQPISGARVNAYRQVWLDDRIAIWDSISNLRETGSDGICLLEPTETDWEVAMISASSGTGESKIEGRAIAEPEIGDQVRVVLKPMSKLGSQKYPSNAVQAMLNSIVMLTSRKGIAHRLIESGSSIFKPVPINEIITTISVRRRVIFSSFVGSGSGKPSMKEYTKNPKRT